MLFQLTILQLFSFEDAKDADNSLLEARGKDISMFLIFLFFSIFNFLRYAVVRFSLLFSTYVVFPLIYLLNILQCVLIVDTAAGADFCDKSTIFVYINFRRCSIIFSLICFLLIYSLKHNNQSVLMVDITAGAEFCHVDTVFSIAQLVMRKLLFSYLIFLRCDMFFVNQVALFFNLNFLRCVILHSLECFLYLLSHNNRFVVMVDTTPGSEMCRCIIIFTFSSISLIRITFYSHGRHHSEC